MKRKLKLPGQSTHTRRTILRRSLVIPALTALDKPSSGGVRSRIRNSDYLFQLGVASGDPTSDGMVLWTRLAPDPLNGGGMPDENIKVKWQISKNEKMTQIVRSGEYIATPQLAHSVHVEVKGLLPDHEYYYQFQVGPEASPVGKTRTFPHPESLPRRCTFAFASCQHYETGYFTAYQHMARQDPDLIIHLGDYIYEGAALEGRVRRHHGLEILTLDDYRNRHAQYKTDPDLQTAHATCPWMVTWDDHEFDNNYADSISEESGVARSVFLQRRARAYQAYYEHMPLRSRSIPSGPNLRLYRATPYGQLIDFNVLDTRQYRSDQPNGDGRKPINDSVLNPDTSMLGKQQEAWLFDRLVASQTTWNVLAQQVMMARVDREPGPQALYSMDQWSGYEAARNRLLHFLDSRDVTNPVILTGDIHTNWVNDLKVNFSESNGPTIATEFVGTSISSGGNGTQTRPETDAMLAENPFVKFFNSERGYVSCQVTPEEWKTDYQVVEYVDRRGAPLVTRASFVVKAGTAGAERL